MYTCRPSTHVSHGLLLPTPLFSNFISFHIQSVFGFCLGSHANWAVSHQHAISDPFYSDPVLHSISVSGPPRLLQKTAKVIRNARRSEQSLFTLFKKWFRPLNYKILELLLPSLYLSAFSLICKIAFNETKRDRNEEVGGLHRWDAN